MNFCRDCRKEQQYPGYCKDCVEAAMKQGYVFMGAAKLVKTSRAIEQLCTESEIASAQTVRNQYF